MERDWCAVLQPIREIVALQQPRHREFGTQLDDVDELERLEPLAVEADLGFVRVQNLEHLLFVRFGVAVDFLARHGRPGGVAAGWVADESGNIANQKNHGMTEILEVFHLPKQDGVAKMEIGSGGIEPGFDAQRAAGFFGLNQALAQFFFAN